MDNVVIVESPSKAKTINKYLGSDYKVLASFGHIRDLPSKDGSVLPEQDFDMIWAVSEGSEKHIKDIISALKGAKNLILASDPDREGEAIAWHIIEELGKRGKLKGLNVGRVTFNEITKSAVTYAIQHPRQIDKELVDAYLARRALDYLVGFSLSPVLWKKLPGSKSAGRVQSVALRLICERENEIDAFKPEEYWTVKGLFANAANQDFSALLTGLQGKKLDKFALNTQAKALAAKEDILSSTYHISELEEKQTSRTPAPPFTTSTLQQEAARKLYMSTKKTMQTAQSLYEGVAIKGETVGLITYMRTDGLQIAKEAIQACRSFIENDFGANYMPSSPRFYKNNVKNAQEAHEAIRPTDIFKTPKSVEPFLTKEQFKLYELIWKRTLASQMEAARYNKVSALLVSSDNRITFRASGQTLLFDGFLKLYFEGVDDKREDDGESEENVVLPPLTKGENTPLKSVTPFQHFTQSPPRYSEASLVKKLEELGIGRPSTYASIISVLQDRDYVRLENRRFIPEDRGRIVTVFLENFFRRYVEYDFTADLETLLDDVSEGKISWKKVLIDFWEKFKQNIDEADTLSFTNVLEKLDEALTQHIFPNPDDKTCPLCHKGTLSLKLGKFGAFIGCSDYPECRYTRPLTEPAKEENAVLENNVKELGSDDKGNAVSLRKGPYGYYVQSGVVSKKKTEKTTGKRVSLLKGMKPENITLQDALALLSLPRNLGKTPTGEEVQAGVGRFGAFVKIGKKFTSLTKDDNVLTVTLGRAIELSQAKPDKKTTLIGNHPETGEEITYGAGRFGPYVKLGRVYASVPKTMEMPTLEEAVRLLKDKAAKPSAKKAKPTAKKPTGKATGKATAPKKTAGKKPKEGK